MKNFKNNYHNKPSYDEIPKGESRTILGQAYKVKDLVARGITGIVPAIAKVPQYDNEDNFDNVNPVRNPSFDLADASAIMQAEKALFDQKGQSASEGDEAASRQSEASEARNEA